jgi:SpoVK/Ycf46/Vps4 family AAA+-type ATPase
MSAERSAGPVPAEPGATDGGVDPALLGALDRLRHRVRAVVAARQAVDPEPDDRFRGLYISDEQARALLDDRPLPPGRLGALPGPGPGRLARAAAAFGLAPLDVDLLVVALGPDLDPRLERAYGYLHDDVTRRRASIGLALELCGHDPLDPAARHRLVDTAPLVAGGLLEVEEPERPFLTRSLRVPDPVATHLLGHDGIDPAVFPLVTDTVVSPDFDTSSIVRALDGGCLLFYVRDRVGAAALSYATSGLLAGGRAALALDLTRVGGEDDLAPLVRAAVRQARLSGAALVAGPVEALAERPGGAALVRRFAEAPGVVVLLGAPTWDPAWARTPPLVLDAPEITGGLHGPGAAGAALPFRLTPEQVVRARNAAELQARAEGVAATDDHLAAGARAQNAGGLERLALRVAPQAEWDDLILPAEVLEALHDVVARVRHRDRVLSDWGLRRGATKGRGVTALFAGDSGTGKTLAAEVLAGSLGHDLYVIDLATVVDKYIGETEKNLDRIFREADRVNGVLLFDEADAIFGKRSEVNDARDRYANVEVAYLLQRMERFDGTAILTTNLRANIDEAFLRRLDALVDFPMPDAEHRLAIWERHLPPLVPRAADVDLDFLSERFDLSGGNIRNIALAAAFLAAARAESGSSQAPAAVAMADLIRATAREYRKLGRLRVETEFGPYHQLVR